MSALRDAADRLRRPEPLAILSQERLFATERAAAGLAGRRRDAGRRTAASRALRQRLAALPRDAAAVAVLIGDALAAERRSVDRALIHAYLSAMPGDPPGFEALRHAAEIAAGRHDWRWRALGERHRLWSPGRDPAGAWRLTDETVRALARGLR